MNEGFRVEWSAGYGDFEDFTIDVGDIDLVLRVSNSLLAELPTVVDGAKQFIIPINSLKGI